MKSMKFFSVQLLILITTSIEPKTNVFAQIITKHQIQAQEITQQFSVQPSIASTDTNWSSKQVNTVMITSKNVATEPDSTPFLISKPPVTIRVQSQLQTNLFKYLSNTSNQQSILQTALSLHNGDYHNSCVYFGSEALRRIGVSQSSLPLYTSTIVQFIADLKNIGWKTSTDYKQLLPGDICFTTDENLNNGIPTHTYIFMKWVTVDNYDFAYICDNQAPEYNNQVNHIRNITKVVYTSSGKKEPFLFFMYK
jgi:hypothetical protein